PWRRGDASRSRCACMARCAGRTSRPIRSSPRLRPGDSSAAASGRWRARPSSASSAATAGTSVDGMEILRLVVGTVLLRPYVFVFLAVYLMAAVTKMGWAKTATFTLVAWAIAYAAEFSSTRNGFPFGMYVYVDASRDRELWLANI